MPLLGHIAASMAWGSGFTVGFLVVLLPQLIVFCLVYLFPSLRKMEVWTIHHPLQKKVSDQLGVGFGCGSKLMQTYEHLPHLFLSPFPPSPG